MSFKDKEFEVKREVEVTLIPAGQKYTIPAGTKGVITQALGVSYGKVTMGVAYGNMLGNMYQPFWSLPLLGLMGLRARDIMGYGLVLFVSCFPVLAAALLLG